MDGFSWDARGCSKQHIEGRLLPTWLANRLAARLEPFPLAPPGLDGLLLLVMLCLTCPGLGTRWALWPATSSPRLRIEDVCKLPMSSTASDDRLLYCPKVLKLSVEKKELRSEFCKVHVSPVLSESRPWLAVRGEHSWLDLSEEQERTALSNSHASTVLPANSCSSISAFASHTGSLSPVFAIPVGTGSSASGVSSSAFEGSMASNFGLAALPSNADTAF
mmetsp:Transcript_32804/g.61174  ORF Transcript_32804/g.61174 Transcript_32804/m.61174 type:complete len:220 (-) Transcript_32804:634-1293(-)